MSVAATLHLNFAGEARQALEFYQSVFGGQLTIATYADFGAPGDSPDATAVVFGQVAADNGFRVMAYDVPATGRSAALAGSDGDRAQTRREYGTTITGERFFVSLNGDDTDEITVQWEALAKGATIIEPLAPTAWAPLFGMLTDRFGITWSIGVSAPYTG